MINEQLASLAVPVKLLVPDPQNARLHDEANLESIKFSLEEYGQQKAIVVNADHVVIAGNGTLMAAIDLGWTEIAAVVYDGEGDEEGFGLADNRSAELGKWDFRSLAGRLQSLKDKGMTIGKLGWKDYELEPLLHAEWRPPKSNSSALDVAVEKHETIRITGEQNKSVRKAIAKVREEKDEDLSDGRCLEIICKAHLAKYKAQAAADAKKAKGREAPAKKPARKTAKKAAKK